MPGQAIYLTCLEGAAAMPPPEGDIRVTDALDVVFDPKFFCKTKQGVHVKADKECSFYSTNSRRIKLEIKRGATTTTLPDLFYRPTHCSSRVNAALVKGDVLNMYMDPDADARDIYGTVATISWVYYVDA
jgi:hypothetical protein